MVTSARIYRAKPKVLWRAIGGLTFFYFVLGGSLWHHFYIEKGPLASDAILLAAFLLLAHFFMLSPLAFCVKLDESGFHFRRYFRWRFWSWDDFSDGLVYRIRDAETLRRRENTGNPRTVLLHDLRDEDCGEIIKHLTRAMPATQEIEPPESIEVRLGPQKFWIQTYAVFEADGVRWRRGKIKKHFQWSEVDALKILRATRDHRDFWHIKLRVGDVSINFCVDRHEGYNKDWNGPDAELVAAYLVKQIEPEKIVDASLQGEALNVREAEFREEIISDELSRMANGSRMVLGVLGLALISVWALIMLGSRDSPPIRFFLLGLACIAVIMAWLSRGLRQGRPRMEAQLRGLETREDK